MAVRGRGLTTALACVLGAATLAIGIGAASGAKLKTKSATTEIGPLDYGAATAKCKKGTKAVSGGFETELDWTFTEEAIFVDRSSRTGGRRWTSEGSNDSSEAGDLTSYAYCRDEKVKRKSATTEVEVEEIESVTARCKRGTKVFSGGFDSDQFDPSATTSPWFWLIQSLKQGKREWLVSAFNAGNVEGDLTAHVYCREGKKVKTKQAEGRLEADFEEETLEPTCTRKQRVVSGGFDTVSNWQNTGANVKESRKTGKRTWRVTAEEAIGSDPHDLIAYAYCEKKKN